MKFELEYKNIHFIISLEKELNFIPDNRFQKLGNNTLIALKKNELSAYSLLIESSLNSEELTHYIPSVILSNQSDEILDELQDYLDAENIIEDICEFWNENMNDKTGPNWKV